MSPTKTRREFEHNLFLLAEDTNRIVESRNDDLIKYLFGVPFPLVKGIKSYPRYLHTAKFLLITIMQKL
jgi:hypothetical protein